MLSGVTETQANISHAFAVQKTQETLELSDFTLSVREVHDKDFI